MLPSARFQKTSLSPRNQSRRAGRPAIQSTVVFSKCRTCAHNIHVEIDIGHTTQPHHINYQVTSSSSGPRSSCESTWVRVLGTRESFRLKLVWMRRFYDGTRRFNESSRRAAARTSYSSVTTGLSKNGFDGETAHSWLSGLKLMPPSQQLCANSFRTVPDGVIWADGGDAQFEPRGRTRPRDTATARENASARARAPRHTFRRWRRRVESGDVPATGGDGWRAASLSFSLLLPLGARDASTARRSERPQNSLHPRRDAEGADARHSQHTSRREWRDADTHSLEDAARACARRYEADLLTARTQTRDSTHAR